MSFDFRTLQVVVIGDILLDRYLYGRIKRLSPESEHTPLVDIEKEVFKMGGAANVVRNIQTLGATPFLFGVVGEDTYAKTFYDLMLGQNLDTKGVQTDKNRPTTIKNRIYDGEKQLVRYDIESIKSISRYMEDALYTAIENCLKTKRIDVLIFQDYNKGLLTPYLINKVIRLTKKYCIPTIVDPKKDNFFAYKGVDVFKPNLRELTEQIKGGIQDLKKALAKTKKKLECQTILLTMSERGICYYTNPDTYKNIPAHKRSIIDVSGAGDTVVSVAALLLALKQDVSTMAYYANLAGGLVCEKKGVASLDYKELFGH